MAVAAGRHAVAVAAPPAIINADPTPYDAMATQVIRGDIPAILSRIHVS